VLEPVLKFVGTAWAFIRHPGRFSQAWVAGQQEAMNPITFIGAAAALLIFAMRAVGAMTDRPFAPTFFSQLRLALAPQLYYAQYGLVAHLVLRMMGSQRRWTSSVAISLFAGAIFPTLAMLLSFGLILWVHLTSGLLPDVPPIQAFPPWARILALTLVVGGFSGFFFTFSWALGAMHRVSVARMTVALLAAQLVTGVVARVVPLPTMQFVAKLSYVGSIPVPSFTVKF
jgi:hypothetical protein